MGRQRGKLGRFHIIHEEEKAFRQGWMDLHGPFQLRVRKIAKDQSVRMDQFSAIARQDSGAQYAIVSRVVGNLRSINQSLGGCASVAEEKSWTDWGHELGILSGHQMPRDNL